MVAIFRNRIKSPLFRRFIRFSSRIMEDTLLGDLLRA